MKPVLYLLTLILVASCSNSHPAWLNNYYRYRKNLTVFPPDKIFRLGYSPGDTTLPADKLKEIEFLIAYNLDLGFIQENIKIMDSLRVLDLSQAKPNHFPMVIFDIPQLVSLNLEIADSSFAIDTLALHFTKLHNLELLGLIRCELKEVPASITSLKKLKYLNLAANNISNISGIDKLDSLVELDLSANNLHRLPTELNNLHFLKSLNLGDNPNLQITKEFAEQLNKNLPYLQVIWLFNTKLSKEEGNELEKIFKNKTIVLQLEE